MSTDFSFTIARMKAFIKPECSLKDASIPVAKNLPEGMRSKYADDYMSGCYTSLVGHLENMTFLPVLKASLPRGTKVYNNLWALRYKLDVTQPLNKQVTRIGARITFRGDQQVAGSYQEGQLYAGNTNPSITRMLMKLLIDFPEAKSNVSDARQAFSHSPAEEVFYMHFPRHFSCVEYPEPSYVWVLRTVLEGAKQGGSAWDTYRTAILAEMNFTVTDACTALYYLEDLTGFLITGFQVDDALSVYTSDSLFKKFISAMKQHVEMKDLGPLTHFCGVEYQIDQIAGVAKAHMTPYIEACQDLFKGYVREKCKCDTPMDPNHRYSSETMPTCPVEVQRMKKFPMRQLLGCLWWIGMQCRVDILMSVHLLSRFTTNPSHEIWQATLRIMDYLIKTKHIGVCMVRNDHPHYHDMFDNMRDPNLPWDEQLVIFTDSDWCNDPDSRRSRGAILVFFYGALTTWKTVLIGKDVPGRICHSVAEAEYRMLSEGIKESIWQRRLIQSVNLPRATDPTPIGFVPRAQNRTITCLSDNSAALSIIRNKGVATRSKHIEVSVHECKESVLNRDVNTLHVPGLSNPADMPTKLHAKPDHYRHISRLMGGPKAQAHFDATCAIGRPGGPSSS
jgi:hypothetical protein